MIRTKNPSCSIMDYLDKKETVLDLGCGYGQPFIDTKFKLLVGVDAWKKIFELPEYHLILYHDIRKVSKFISPDSFDVVTAIDVIEHLTKKEGLKLIKDMERIARKKVLIFTPLIWSDNKSSFENPEYWSYGNDKYNLHRSLWNKQDFVDRGYDILECQKDYVLAGKKLKRK